MPARVLVIEPHADFRAEIVATLAHMHIECDSVSCLKDAMLKVRDHNYRCILVDEAAAAPDDVVALVGSNPSPDQKLVIMTDDNPQLASRPGSGKTWPQLRKPFDRRELIAKML